MRTTYPEAKLIKTLKICANTFKCTYMINNDYEANWIAEADTQAAAEVLTWKLAQEVAAKECKWFALMTVPIANTQKGG